MLYSSVEILLPEDDPEESNVSYTVNANGKWCAATRNSLEIQEHRAEETRCCQDCCDGLYNFFLKLCECCKSMWSVGCKCYVCFVQCFIQMLPLVALIAVVLFFHIILSADSD